MYVIRMYVCTSVRLYVCMYVCMYIYVHACMYICTHLRIQRYLGDRLTAFVVESSGCSSGEARQWLLRHSSELPEDLHVAGQARAYKATSCAVHAQVAKQLRRAASLK